MNRGLSAVACRQALLLLLQRDYTTGYAGENEML